MEETSAQLGAINVQLFDCWKADIWIIFYLLMSVDTHIFTWLISRAFSRTVTYHTSDDAAFPEADGQYSAMSYMRIFLYDVQNLNGFIQGVWLYDRWRFALFYGGPQLQHYVLMQFQEHIHGEQFRQIWKKPLQ